MVYSNIPDNIASITYSQSADKFTEYPSKLLISDNFTSINFRCVIISDNSIYGEYSPGTPQNNSKWFNVITSGTMNRCTQIAYDVFNKTGEFYIRIQHDNIVTDWYKYKSSDISNALDTANSALNTANSKAPISHAATSTTYGVGTSSNYGHLKIMSDIAINSSVADTAISPASLNKIYKSFELTSQQPYLTIRINGANTTGDIKLIVGVGAEIIILEVNCSLLTSSLSSNSVGWSSLASVGNKRVSRVEAMIENNANTLVRIFVSLTSANSCVVFSLTWFRRLASVGYS